jgi:hypothetical protein
MMEFIFDTARTVSDLLFRGVFTRHAGIEWIFTHGGVQAQLRRLWFDMAGTPFPNQVPALVKAFGSDRVLYGSDYCWTPAAGVTAQVASVDAASDGGSGGTDWRALTSANAARLLPRFGGLTVGSRVEPPYVQENLEHHPERTGVPPDRPASSRPAERAGRRPPVSSPTPARPRSR